jgi:Asp-tRNA(Asn)/Glu-tRNA(Gln) amidotransferase A subunit family amidase
MKKSMMETQPTAIEKERANIAQCGDLLRTQQISPVELVDRCLSRFEEWNLGLKPQALSAENTIFANYCGLPAISVPCGFARNGLPLGLQIVGKPWDEVTAIHLANQFKMAVAR